MAIYVDPNGNAMDKPLSGSRAVSLRTPAGPVTAAPVPQAPPVNMGMAQEVPTMRNVQNPNVGPGRVSPEAAQWQSMRSAPSVPGAAATEAAAAQAGRGAVFRAGQAVGRVAGGLRGAAPLMAAGGTIGALSDATDEDSTARYAKRFGVSEPTGDGSLGDIAKFAALRAGGFASDLGVNILDTGTGIVNGVRKATGAAPIPTFRSLLFRDGDPNQPAAAPAAPTLRGPAPTAVQTAAQQQAAPAPAVPTQPQNVVLRNGNSFSGENVREGFQYQDPNGMRTQAGSVNTVPTMATLDPALAARLSEARGAAVARGESLGPGGVISLGGSRGGSDVEALARSGKLTAAGLNAVMQSRGQDLNYDATLRGQGVQQRGQDLNYDLGMRGQDVQMRGQDMSNQVARAQARIEQMNKDRQYQLDVAKFGEERAKTMFNQREESDKNLTSKLEAMFSTRDDKGNMVVDKQRVAAHKAGITAAIGERAAALEAVPKNSPDYETAQKLAGQLRDKGAAALSEDGLQRLIAQLEVKQRSADAHSSWNPFAGTHVDSANPADYDVVGKRNGLITDDYVLRNGGTIPTRKLDKAEGDLFGGQRTTRFDILKQGLRQ